MIVELVSTGTELLLGEILNTNAPYLAQHLNEMGFDVLFQSTVGDNPGRMSQVISTALSRADIVITSGGLGPTQGDITKHVTAEILKRSLYLHQPSAARIKGYFKARNIPMPDSNFRQAMMPEGAIVIDNERGTAPGVIIEEPLKVIIHLPGPPRELEFMFEKSIVPYLKQKFGNQGSIVSRVLHTAGIGESSLEEKIADLIAKQSNPTIALLARKGEIIIRLTAKAPSENQANALIADLEKIIRERVGQFIFGTDRESLEMVIGRLLSERKMTLALAESCTGGMVSSRITDISGSSEYLTGGVVCYSNQLKEQLVHVPHEILEQYGAVSSQTAVKMAEGIRQQCGTTFGVGITGIAGPGGATANKPVGLVFIAVDGPDGVYWCQHNFTGERAEIKQRTATAALNQLYHYLIKV